MTTVKRTDRLDPRAVRLGLYFGLGGLLVVADTTVTIVALPKLMEDFGVGLSTAQWATTGYALALVAVMPSAAWAIGRFGGRRMYLFALAMFTAGSLCTGLAWDIGSLVGFRVLQGVGGGLLNPVAMAIALAEVPARRRGAMMSLQGLAVLVGPLFGAVLGGVLIDQQSWRWAFWINVPIGAVALLVGARVLPRARPETPGEPLDWLGLLLLCPGVALAVYGLSALGDHPGTPAVYLPALLGVVLVAVFGVRSWRHPRPLLRLRVLRNPAMRVGSVTFLLFAAAYFGPFLIWPTYIQLVRGDSATDTGVIGIPQALATGLIMQVATRLVDRVQPRIVVGVGITVALVGTVARAVVLEADTPYWLVMGLGALTGLGVGSTMMPIMTAASRGLTGPDLAAGSTVLSLLGQVSVAVGTALFATVLSWRVAAQAPDLAGGLAAAARLAPGARAGFAPALAGALQWTLASSAVLIGLALLVSRLLPRERPEPAGESTPATVPDGQREQAVEGG